MAQQNRSVLFEKIGKVGSITLNRPDKYNSFTRDLALNLQADLDRCREDPGIRAVYLTGAGKAFCAGQDLQEATESGASLGTILTQLLNPVVERIRALEKPVLCGVNGVAAGAGASLAMACDIILAKESAYFMQAFSKIGLIPDTGGTYFLPRLVGPQRAAALMMLGEKVPAKVAVIMGMIYQAIPDEEFDQRAMALAEHLSERPTRGLALTKKALQASLQNTFAQQLALEVELQEQAGQTNDYREGVQAFLQKRKPTFNGN